MRGIDGLRGYAKAGAVGTVLLLGLFAFLAYSTLRAQGEQSALSWALLRNTTYPSEFPRAKEAPLHDGVYEEEAAPGSATRLRIQLADIAGFGKIDAGNSVDAAVVLISSPGGSGTFIHLVAVLNEAGTASPAASVLLGDRVAVRSIRIEDGKVIVGLRVRGPSDPLALLTREVMRVYSLIDGELILEDEQTSDVSSVPPNQFAFEPQRLVIGLGKGIARQGTLPPGELATYLVHGEAGRELRLSVKSQFNNAVLSIQGVDDTAQLLSRTSYATAWSGNLPSSQDYAITVVTLAGNDLKYELTVELRAAPTPVPTATARPLPTATRPPGSSIAPAVPAPLKGSPRLTQVALSDLSLGASTFLESRTPVWGAAVLSPGTGVVYSQHGDVQLELASVVKVVIALAILNAAERENRYVDRFELSLLWPMITLSDNDSATKLWDQLGGGRELAGYLSSIGATGINPYDGPFWGTSTASATSLATLLARAVFGDLLSSAHRDLLLTLLEQVSPSQRWGISAGAEGDAGTGDLIGLKNGWYPDELGWRVNSIGFLVSRDGQDYYTIAVLANGQPTWSYGIETIEGVAARVRSAPALLP